MNNIILEDFTNPLVESYSFLSEENNMIEMNYNVENASLLLDESNMLLDEGILDVISNNPLGGILPDLSNDLDIVMSILGNSLCSVPRNADSVDVENTRKLLEQHMNSKAGDLKSRHLRLYDENCDYEKFQEALKSKTFKQNVKNFFSMFAKSVVFFTVTTVGFRALVGDFKDSKKSVKKIAKRQNSKKFNGMKLNTKEILKKGFGPMIRKWKSEFLSWFEKSGDKYKLSSKGKGLGVEWAKALTKIGAVTLGNAILTSDSYFLFKIDEYTLITFFPKNAISMSNFLYPGYLLLTNNDSGNIVFDSINVCGKHID